MKGRVISGQGKGAFYVQYYAPELQKALGFLPYGGTLNIQLSRPPRLPLSKKKAVIKTNYGDVDCYPILFQKKYKGAIVRPQKTTHPPQIVEIISPFNLRETLHLRDGDEIECALA